MLNLPRKDKYGKSYLSYSSISLFLKDKDAFYESYVLNKPFVGNEYTDFGSKVGKALEINDFSLFNDSEQLILKKATRLDLFERKVILQYDDFYIIGFIDTCTLDCKRIVDYKTGGSRKELEYQKEDYTQLCYYSLAIKQELGYFPDSANVEFIRRQGNTFKNELLTVANENPILIPIDISYERCRQLYFKTKEIAKSIEQFYLKYK